MSGHTIGSMIWGFLFYIGILQTIVNTAVFIASIKYSGRKMRYLSYNLALTSIPIGIYLVLYPVISLLNFNSLTGILESAVVVLFSLVIFGWPATTSILNLYINREK